MGRCISSLRRPDVMTKTKAKSTRKGTSPETAIEKRPPEHLAARAHAHHSPASDLFPSNRAPAPHRATALMRTTTPAAGSPRRARMMKGMQQTAGNTRISHMLGDANQPKLGVGTPQDAAEQASDHAAEHVLRTPDSSMTVQRACAHCEKEKQAASTKGHGPNKLISQPGGSATKGSGPTLQREPAPPVSVPPGAAGCSNPDEHFYSTSPNHCKDTALTGSEHIKPGSPWKRCYREVPTRGFLQCPPGKHVCFDDSGHCGDEHIDQIAPFDRGEDGECTWSPWLCILEHGVVDLIPAKLGQIEAEKMKRLEACEELPWYEKALCQMGASGVTFGP